MILLIPKIRHLFVKNNHVSWFDQNDSLYKLAYFCLSMHFSIITIIIIIICYLLYNTVSNVETTKSSIKGQRFTSKAILNILLYKTNYNYIP